jgi:hypothetical protein
MDFQLRIIKIIAFKKQYCTIKILKRLILLHNSIITHVYYFFCILSGSY